MEQPVAITIDTLGALARYGGRMFGCCNDCARLYRMDRQANPPAHWNVDLGRLIAERGPRHRFVSMPPLRCPYCGGRRTEFRITFPHRHDDPAPPRSGH